MSKRIAPSPDSQELLSFLEDHSEKDTVSRSGGERIQQIVLIDLENVQPSSLDALATLPVRIYVFAGQKQSKISLDFAAAMQRLGKRAAYVRMTGNGPNALDFHIAFYIGELAASAPEARFYIVSKDKGFDPLVTHLGNREGRPIRVKRVSNIGSIAQAPKPRKDPMEKQINVVLKNLIARGNSKPRKKETLSNTINTLFSTPLSEPELEKLLQALQARGLISLANGNVSYNFPG